jgi:hypothetical protein
VCVGGVVMREGNKERITQMEANDKGEYEVTRSA